MVDMLATPVELASFLQQDVDTASATLAIQLATGMVQTAVGQRIVQALDETVTIDVDACFRGQWLRLPEMPVTAVGAVQVGAAAVNDFVLQRRAGMLWRLRGWKSAVAVNAMSVLAPSTVTVTYSHGYADGDQRLELARAAALSVAKTLYANPSGAIREQVDDYAVQYDTPNVGLTPALTSALRRRYGRPSGNSVRLSRDGTAFYDARDNASQAWV